MIVSMDSKECIHPSRETVLACIISEIEGNLGNIKSDIECQVARRLRDREERYSRNAGYIPRKFAF